jgi:2-amino-4-hydroxy-6-hydroxymethyldihydropteridine diphosphokinase
MNDVILLIGGNQGNRLLYLNEAIQEIKKRIGVIELRSHIYETAPWGIQEQPPFYNQVLGVQTNLSPKEVMSEILSIEEQMGRKRMEKNGPRIIDIDILYFGDTIIQEEQLEIPHPRIAERRFVLTPLAELYPEWIDPVRKITITEMLDQCKDSLSVDKLPPDCA